MWWHLRLLMVLDHDLHNMPVTSRPALKWGHLQGTDSACKIASYGVSYLEPDILLMNKFDIDIKSSSWDKRNRRNFGGGWYIIFICTKVNNVHVQCTNLKCTVWWTFTYIYPSNDHNYAGKDIDSFQYPSSLLLSPFQPNLPPKG